MELLSIAFIFIGIMLGFLIAHFRSQSHLSRLEERNEQLNREAKQSREQVQKEQARANEAAKQLAGIEADYCNLQGRLNEQKEEMENLQKRFKDEFENMANQILEKKSEKFTEQNKQNLDQLLKPLGEKLEAFKKKVEDTHKQDIKERGALQQHLKHLYELNQKMTKEAKDLTNALKGESKTQGSWGEVILERILEKSGLTKGREYEVQQSVTTDDGRRLQPDVVVKLPDKKRLVIDSKVSLTAYERFSSAEDEAERTAALKQHIASLRSHIKGLGNKNYQQLHGIKSPDFVLMFVPIESAFGIALQKDTNLYYDAFEKNIVLVSPSTLLATLATINSVWKQEYQSKNAQEIAERGGALYDKFVLFVESMEDIGMRIRQTQESYQQAMGRLSTGNGNVIRQVEMLRQLGAKSNKTLPESLTAAQELEEPVLEDQQADE